MNPRARYHCPGAVLRTGTDAEPYLTDLDTGRVYALNPQAAWVFEAARSGAPAQAAVEGLAAEHPEVPREEIARDVEDVLEAFVRAGILAPA